MNRNERRKLRKEALRAFKEEGQETAYKGRWIRRAETGGVRKLRKRDVRPSDSYEFRKRDLEVALKHRDPISSFLLSEIERAASEDLG